MKEQPLCEKALAQMEADGLRVDVDKERTQPEVWVDVHGELHTSGHVHELIEKAEGHIAGDPRMNGYFSGIFNAVDLLNEETPILYLCDGNVPDCRKIYCYKKGGECQHTTDIFHALNKDSDRYLVSDGFGHLWERTLRLGNNNQRR